MEYSSERTPKFFIPIQCADNKKVYSDNGIEYQLLQYYKKQLRKYGFKLITYSNGTFVIVDFQSKLTGHIILRQVGRVVKRIRQYKKRHSVRQIHNYIDKLIEEALR